MTQVVEQPKEIKRQGSRYIEKTPKKLSLLDQRNRDREIVKGIFRFHEVPGGTMSFSYKEYKQDDVENFTLNDGEVYSIPLGVARHLNKNCSYPVHSYQVDESGKAVQKIGQKVRRCSFQSLEFIDAEDLTPVGNSELVTVERM